MNIEQELMKKMKKNKKINSWWLKAFQNPIVKILTKNKIPHQTIGVFMNPLTSNNERVRIIRFFIFKDKKQP
jgi:hypothetical protein